MPETDTPTSSSQVGNVLVWDIESVPPAGTGSTILWRALPTEASLECISIPQLIEENSDTLRARYLAWIYELGEIVIDGKRLVDHLEIRPGFSYWWMSSLAQKANLSPTSLVNDAIKVLALNDLIIKHKFSSITLISSNPRLSDCIFLLCQAQGIQYEWRSIEKIEKKHNVAFLYGLLSSQLRALIYFFWYLFRMVPVLSQKKTIRNGSTGEIAFVDILVHLGNSSLSTGKFISNYWGKLVEKLSEWNVKSNWLHHYFRHSSLSSPIAAIALTQRFSSSSNGLQIHRLTEQYLTFESLYRAARDYLNIRKKFHHLKSLLKIQSQDPDGFLWPLHADEWRESLTGKEAVKNCITLSLAESAISNLPRQKIGVYIQENQPWEMALIYAWKSSGHGVLIGTPHSTVRFWDLRYFFDKRCFLGGETCNLPFPDILAVNGPVAKKNLLSSGYLEDRIREVEALRYLHLLRPSFRNQQDGAVARPKRVLICGDFRRNPTLRMLSLLDDAEKVSPTNNIYIFKPHPAYNINTSVCSKIKMRISNNSMADSLAECDLVFASNTTSAAVDAYCLGIPVIQILEDSGLNLSPLRGLPNIIYIKNHIELAKEMKNPVNIESDSFQNYFYLNESLSGWKKLLNINGS